MTIVSQIIFFHIGKKVKIYVHLYYSNCLLAAVDKELQNYLPVETRRSGPNQPLTTLTRS